MPVNVARRPIVASALAGTVILVTAGTQDRLPLGVFICAGIVLGLINAWLTRIGMVRLDGDSASGRSRSTALAGMRLFVVSASALIIGVLTRPDGLGILFGLVTVRLGALLWNSVSVLRGAR
ncbi:hypothetical protein [Nocardia wallacei]|uniref:hypothetical protein n=1 Tax=Nocardia wallacei TaxID=480035 RepID=UPI0024566362|nr:hypothetical protein [Nocardia wallacei]